MTNSGGFTMRTTTSCYWEKLKMSRLAFIFTACFWIVSAVSAGLFWLLVKNIRSPGAWASPPPAFPELLLPELLVAPSLLLKLLVFEGWSSYFFAAGDSVLASENFVCFYTPFLLPEPLPFPLPLLLAPFHTISKSRLAYVFVGCCTFWPKSANMSSKFLAFEGS